MLLNKENWKCTRSYYKKTHQHKINNIIIMNSRPKLQKHSDLENEKVLSDEFIKKNMYFS